MQNRIVAVVSGLLVLASVMGVAALGENEPGQPLADEGTSMVRFKDMPQDGPSADGPAQPGPGAPGPYEGPGADAVPSTWKSWAQDEHNQCGSLRLLFGNQDLNRELQDPAEMVHAQGSFFIQFQAIGEGAQDITRFSFSFGKSDEALDQNPTVNCNSLVPDNPLGKGTAGAYLLFYRSDFVADDGFFIPVETRNVPDGTYAAAVHAYTGDSIVGYTEVARAWALAEVKNCNGSSLPNSCPDDHPDDVVANDFTQPWPWVLPGDGTQENDVDGLTIEILEEVPSIKAWLNGMELELENWTPPQRDRDLLPMNDDGSEIEGCHGLPGSSFCRHEVYSEGWKWEGGEIKEGDVIQVEATDKNGNRVFKSIFWDGVGGVIDEDFPIIDFNLLDSQRQTIKAGEELRYNMRIENTGGSDAHVDFWLALDGGPRNQTIDEEHIQAEWMDMSFDHDHPTHLHLRPAQVVEIYVDIATNQETPNGTYFVEASLTYPALGEEQLRSFDLELEVDGALPASDNETEDQDDAELEDTPMPGVVLVVGLLLGAVVGLRRRSRKD